MWGDREWCSEWPLEKKSKSNVELESGDFSMCHCFQPPLPNFSLPRWLLRLPPLSTVSTWHHCELLYFFYSYGFALLMLFSECHALRSLCAPSLAAPLASLCPCFFHMFLFFLVSIVFTHSQFLNPRLDAKSTPLDWTLSQCPSTTCRIDTPRPHATSLPGHAAITGPHADVRGGAGCAKPGNIVLRLDCRIRL